MIKNILAPLFTANNIILSTLSVRSAVQCTYYVMQWYNIGGNDKV